MFWNYSLFEHLLRRLNSTVKAKERCTFTGSLNEMINFSKSQPTIMIVILKLIVECALSNVAIFVM